MGIIGEWIRRLGYLLRRGAREEELRREMEAHRAMLQEPRAFGNTLRLREEARDAWGWRWLDDLARDTRFAWRTLRRSPAFALTAIVTLALGIGATGAIFTLVRSVLLRPLPFPDPDALYVISYASPGPAWLYPGMSDRGYLDFRGANRTLESVATFSAAESTMTGAGNATRVSGAAVTTDFFRVLGVDAAIGRTFGPEDDQSGGGRVVLIADGLWRRHFGADPLFVNKTVVLNGVPHRVVGVLPPGFSYPADAAYWIPLTVRINPNLGYTRPVIGRVKAGVTGEQAAADLDVWVRSLPPDPNRPRDLVAQVTPLHEAMVRDVRLPVLVFGSAVVLVLAIVCANVMHLLLMRAVSRRQEIATRLAMGGSRVRVVRQFLAEGALLSLAGGSVGAGVAFLGGPALLSLIPPGRLPVDIAVRADGWVLAFTAGLSVFTALVVGLAPIVQISGDSPYVALRGGTVSDTRQSHRLRHALVISELALTLVLLVGAGLLVRSVIGLRSVPLGFTPGRVMTMTIDLPVTRYPKAEQATALHSRLLQSLSASPGVLSVAAVNWLPLGDMVTWGDVQAEDRPDLAGKYNATKVAVSPDYFRTIGIRLLRGRPFTEADRPGRPPVAIVSESVARRLWPGVDPSGRRMALVDRPKPEDWLTVVGVVEDVRQGGFRSAPTHAVYQPYVQVTNRYFVGYMTFLVRTHGDPLQVAPTMRTALARIDHDEAPRSLATLETVVDRTVAEPQFHARVLTLFSLVALLLAAIGIYGVLASAVLERRSEIGVRMALGADRTSVIRMILSHTLQLTAIGITIGLAGSLAAADAIASLLFGVTPTDTATFVIAVGVLLGAAVAAAVVPARRAARLDPITVLRAE
jgi:putative ABC transport system permease protein